MLYKENDQLKGDKKLELCEKSENCDALKCSPIGVFDSGLGGLTLFKELRKLMPFENIIYFGDTDRVPYGAKSEEQIKKCAAQDINFLNTFSPKITVAACGTISSYLTESNFDSVNPIGVIEPTCLSAAKKTQNKKIGIMCTDATAKSKSYEKCLMKIDPKFEVFTKGCPRLVNIIESGNVSGENSELLNAVKLYVDSLLFYGVDTIILGCTHYPIIKEIIGRFAGNSVNLINSGLETAKFVKDYILDKKLNNNCESDGHAKFYVSGNTKTFSETAEIFLGTDISKNVFKMNIDEY